MTPASNPGELDSIPPELRDRAFQLRPVWQRFLVVLAGPVANFLLAILIFAAFFAFAGTPRTNVVGDVVAEVRAAAAPAFGRATGSFPSPAGNADLRRHRQRRRVRPSETSRSSSSAAEQRSECTVKLGSTICRRDRAEDARGVLGIHSTTTIGEPVPLYQAVPMAVDQTRG